MENTNQPAAPATAAPATAAPATTETKPVATTEAKAPEPRKYANKYDTVEALEKGYNDLNARFTKSQQAATETPAADPKAPAKVDGPIWHALSAELQANQGKLSDKTVDLLNEKMGIPHAVAREFETFLKSKQDATAANLQKRLEKDVGDGVTVQDVVDNAHKYLSPAQWKNVQDGLDQGLEGAFIDAARLVAKNRKAPASIGSVDQATKGGYSSAKDISAATNDSKFGVDRAYTRAVEAMISATPQSIVNEWAAIGKKR